MASRLINLRLTFIQFVCFNDAIGQFAVFQHRQCQLPVISKFHATIENLVKHVIDNVVKKVVPWESKENVLKQTKSGKSRHDMI